MTRRPGPQILVMNDQPEHRQAIADALAPLDARVVLAESGDAALRHLLRAEFALILLDVKAASAEGFDIARMIKGRPKSRDVPLIFTSAAAEPRAFQARGYALGAVDYLPTPIDPDQVRAKASVFLELARQNARLRQQADELKRAVEHKDQFLAIVSHELNTPLAGVIGFTELLADALGPRLGREERGYIAEITAATDRLKRVVDNMLDMGRIQAGRLTLRPEPTDFRGVLAAALHQVEAEARDKGLALETAVDEALPELDIDPDYVGRVLYNLVINAVKFSPAAGRIVVSVTQAGRFLRCEVRDQGPGIPKALQRRIFESFGQVDTTTTRERGGTGLGLSISKAIVEAHGGAIGVKSRPGAGSAFWIRLPLGRTARRPGGATCSPASRAAGAGPRGPRRS